MEIGSLDFEDPYDVYKGLNPKLQEWEKIGHTALISFSFIAVSAFIPALLKKKRIYSQSFPSIIAPTVEIVEPAPAGERPLPIPTPHCTPPEQRKVEEIFKTVAEGNMATLAWNAFRLNTLGKEIDHIHPFSLLLAVPKEHMRAIFNEGNIFKIKNVMDGIKKGMEREKVQNKLERYIPAFAVEMGKTAEAIRPLIQTNNWRGLVEHLYSSRIYS